MLARFLLTLGCVLATVPTQPLCAQDSGSDTAKDSEAGSGLVLGNPGGNSADAASTSDASAEKNAENAKPRSLLDESSRKLVEPKRLPVKSVSGNPLEKSTAEDAKKAPTKPPPTNKQATPTPAKPMSQAGSAPAKPKSSNPSSAKNSAATTSSDTQPTVAESKATLRPIEPKKLIEKPSPEGGETFLMRYKFEPGMVVRSEVTYLSKNGTRIDSVQQDATSRTVSMKSWRVLDTEEDVVTFEYRIDEIDMSQQVGSGNEVRYSSKEASDEPPPVQFAGAADNVGKVVSTISIDGKGMVVARSDTQNPPHLGMGDVTLPLPENPVAVGATWEIPREMRIPRKDGSSRLLKFRELFKLEKVSAGIATISVRSEPLSTISDPSEEAQVLQQLSNGTIRFDLDAGRMVSKDLAWDHEVVAFSGPGSVLEYSARLDDHVVTVDTEKRTATRPSNAAR
jgi:hypothetical protein